MCNIQAVLLFDGLCEPTNPGGYGCWGYELHWSSELVSEFGCLGRYPWVTNNYAEYVALGKGLVSIANDPRLPKVKSLTILGDSQLVINQINRDWKCEAKLLGKLRDRCFDILDNKIKKPWVARWIPRAVNEHADALTNQAYQEAVAKASNKFSGETAQTL